MPQAAQRKDLNAQKAQDKESKRARGALSCAECRRLKLKCDKTVPCSSCKRRGCSAICPNGSLITGQGTRFVLADTEKLHAKIAQMSDRIRHLEDALAVSHSTTSNEPHPLLGRDLMKIKSSLELHAAVEDEDKEPVANDDGAATFYGRSAGSERENPSGSPTPAGGQPGPSDLSQQRYTSPDVLALASSFPLASVVYRPGIDVEYILSNYLPPWQEAVRLYQLYLEQAPWFFGAVTRRQLEEEVLPLWYKEAPRTALASSPILSDFGDGTPRGNAHDLALLFIIFCFGSMTDMAMPPAPNNPEADHYYELVKACLTIEPILTRPPAVSTVQALAGILGKENSIETTWVLFGLATKLAQSVDRDCARWKLSPAEVQKRRALFWELFITDCWQALATGRLATFSLPFVDCELPADPDQTMADDGATVHSFPHWKARFGAECVSAVVQGTLTSRAPKYSIILELDRKVRDMELPLYAQGPVPGGLGLAQTMSHFMPTNYRELTLLYIHRCFFAHALSSNTADPLKSQYAPSFLAGYRSACAIIGAVKEQFTLFPAQIARFWVLWTHAFSASVMIGSVVTHNPKCKVAPAALLELKTACDLFEQASSFGGRAVKFLPILKRLQGKAQQVFRDTNAGVPPRIPNDIFRPSNLKEEEEKDDLLIFGGKTHTVTTKAGATSTRTNGDSPRNTNISNSREPSGSPAQMFTDNPSFANVHPSLVNELNSFDEQIRTQIRNAYRHPGDVFGHGNGMAVDPQIRVTPPIDQDSLMASSEPLHPEQEQHQQQFLQQMAQQRRELERRELERQQQQQNAIRQQVQMAEQQRQEEARKQQHYEEQQRQQREQYRQQQAEQQQRLMQDRRRLQQPPISPQSSQNSDYAPYPSPGGSYVSQPSSASAHPLQRVSSRPIGSIHQTMEMPPQTSMQPQYVTSSRHHQQGSISAPSTSSLQQPHYQSQSPGAQMYPEYSGPSPTSASTQSPQYATPAGPSTGYDHHHHASMVPPNAQASTSMTQTPTSAHSPNENYHQYWTAAPATAYSPSGGPGQQRYSSMHQPQHPQQQQQQQGFYSPDVSLRGIAAEDPRLQETWQSYMSNVGSPRLFDD
ncbi:hypothetical protein BKA70DRAFT_1301768 [Coprinopsis sp. MPI-PUGE-AT-0042]|nr:hypothetical protein BKA70DRAFT_1301768 [Coprinopsis sp. MPI-PUGE-AT-0042]